MSLCEVGVGVEELLIQHERGAKITRDGQRGRELLFDGRPLGRELEGAPERRHGRSCVPSRQRAITLPFEDDWAFQYPGDFRHERIRNGGPHIAAQSQMCLCLRAPAEAAIGKRKRIVNGRRRGVGLKRRFEMCDRVRESGFRQRRATHRIVRRGESVLLLERPRQKRCRLVRLPLVEQYAAKPHQRRHVSWTERERLLEVSGGKNRIALHACEVTEVIGPARLRWIEHSGPSEIRFGSGRRFCGHEQLSDGAVLARQPLRRR